MWEERTVRGRAGWGLWSPTETYRDCHRGNQPEDWRVRDRAGFSLVFQSLDLNPGLTPASVFSLLVSTLWVCCLDWGLHPSSALSS